MNGRMQHWRNEANNGIVGCNRWRPSGDSTATIHSTPDLHNAAVRVKRTHTNKQSCWLHTYPDHNSVVLAWTLQLNPPSLSTNVVGSQQCTKLPSCPTHNMGTYECRSPHLPDCVVHLGTGTILVMCIFYDTYRCQHAKQSSDIRRLF